MPGAPPPREGGGQRSDLVLESRRVERRRLHTSVVSSRPQSGGKCVLSSDTHLHPSSTSKLNEGGHTSGPECCKSQDRFWFPDRGRAGLPKLILIIGCCFTTYCNRQLLDLGCHGDDSDDLESLVLNLCSPWCSPELVLSFSVKGKARETVSVNSLKNTGRSRDSHGTHGTHRQTSQPSQLTNAPFGIQLYCSDMKGVVSRVVRWWVWMADVRFVCVIRVSVPRCLFTDMKE